MLKDLVLQEKELSDSKGEDWASDGLDAWCLLVNVGRVKIWHGAASLNDVVRRATSPDITNTTRKGSIA